MTTNTTAEPVKLSTGAHIHLMGICGTAMGGLAGMLKEMGYRVTGSDQNVYPPMSTQLEELGIELMSGYKKENLNPRPDFVIVGNVISRTMEEAQELLSSGIPYTSLPKAIGEWIIDQRSSIVCAGTHGKTTTTTLMSWVAEVCGQNPGFMIGGRPVNFEKSFRVGGGNYFVIEGDEYDTAFFDKVSKFLHYKPRNVILTSVEFDHADIYNNLDEVKDSFFRLMKIIPEDGNLVYFAEDENVREIVATTPCRNCVSYGFNDGDYQARNISLEAEHSSFDLHVRGEFRERIQIAMFGKHNIANALGVLAMTEALGWEKERVLEAFRTFKGVKRRQEIIGKPRDITVIDDFAHHPTAVHLTVRSIRERYDGRRLFAIFEPRSATSRRNIFQKQYVEALAGEWTVVLPNPFNQQNIPESERFSSKQLISDLQERGVDAHLAENADGIVDFLAERAQPGDVILVMSNGGFDGLYTKLLDRLSCS